MPAEADDVERYETRAALPKMDPQVLSDLIKILERKFEIASIMGLKVEGRTKLKAIF